MYLILRVLQDALYAAEYIKERAFLCSRILALSVTLKLGSFSFELPFGCENAMVGSIGLGMVSDNEIFVVTRTK